MSRFLRITSLLLFASTWATQPTLANAPILPSQTLTTDDPAISQALRLEIRLSQRQVMVYRGSHRIKGYPIAVGRPGWETPTGDFKVMEMVKDPAWVHPFKGVRIAGGDPENPLGRRWIGFWTDGKNWIGFHGTPNPQSVGKASSHGCIRMHNKDVEELFQKVSLGTVVRVVK